MFNRDRWSEILEVLSRNVFRTTLTAFGVFWGIFILIILLAAGRGFENGVNMEFGNIATNTMFMWTRTATKAYMGMPKDRRFNYRINDVEDIRQNVPDLLYISPRNQLGGFRGGNPGLLMCTEIIPRSLARSQWTLLQEGLSIIMILMTEEKWLSLVRV